jgi:signal peptidase I
MTQRRSIVAVVLTLLAPGLGHLYLGLPWRALAIWLCSLALTASAFYGILSLPPSLVVGWLPVLVRIAFVAWAAWDAARRARIAAPAEAWYQRWYVLALICLALATALRPFVTAGERRIVEAFRIPSGSMEPTVLIGDYLYTDMRGSARTSVTRGSLVVFTSVEERGLKALKRVVALGGDTVAMRAGRLFVNGAPVDEPYVESLASLHGADADQRASMLKWQDPLLTVRDSVSLHPDLNDWGPLVVPHETLLLLGDNRQASYDSRFWGPLPRRNLLGRPTMIYYSYDPGTGALLPFLTAIRWSRMGIHPR